MNTRIKDITLIKFIGKGSFGTVYLSKKDGKPGYFATKQIERAMADKPGYYKYFENELRLLKDLHHPNIVHLEDVKKDAKYYYIVMEFVNGGSLTDCLKKYLLKYGKAFPEEIVQYLMRQIVDAIKFIHQRNIIHRDLKLDNIMVSFDNENDKNNLNMMRAKVKIIDFGFATKFTKNNLAHTALGSPINMDPLILNVMAKKGKDLKQLGYDDKADIWSLGTICYELLIGQTVFNAETMNDLVQKVESGNYHVPTSVSREVVSFLNAMLQYEGSKRLNADELSKHPFLVKDVRNFTKINTREVRKKIDNKGLNINIKRNQTIWSIFNEDDEKTLIGINDRNNAPPLKPMPEMKIPQDINVNRRYNTDKNIPHIPKNKNLIVNKNYEKTNSNKYPYNGPTHSIYGQNMMPNQNNYSPQYPNFNQIPIMSPFPQNPGYTSGMNAFNPMMPYPTFEPSPNTFNRNIIQINTQGFNPPNYPGSVPQGRVLVFQGNSMGNNEVIDMCSIQ